MFVMLLPLSDEVSVYKIGMLFVAIGLSVGVAAIYKNNLSNFNIRPDIKENCSLITNGIYKYIKHPMYNSVLVSMFGVLLLNFSIIEIVLYAILFINMLVKMFYEESLWLCESKEYILYSKKTKRLIPYVF